MGVDWRARDRIKTLKFSRGGQVETLHVIIEGTQRDDRCQEDRRGIGDDNDNSCNVEQLAHIRLERPSNHPIVKRSSVVLYIRKGLVNGVLVLGETFFNLHFSKKK